MAENDDELEKIRKKKIAELMDKQDSPSDVASGSPVEATDSNFSELIKSNALVVVDCWASWCAPCRMIAPIIEELARDYAGKIVFGKLDVMKNQRVSTEYHVMSIPTLMIFKNGQLVDQIIGAMPRKMLEPKITQYL